MTRSMRMLPLALLAALGGACQAENVEQTGLDAPEEVEEAPAMPIPAQPVPSGGTIGDTSGVLGQDTTMGTLDQDTMGGGSRR